MKIGHMRRVVSRLQSCFYQKNVSSMKQVDLRDMFKKASTSVGISTILTPPNPFVSYSMNFFSYEDSRKHRRGT
jgi:hypothetical protein